MDLKMLMSGIDFSEIENHLKEVVQLVKSENEKIKVLDSSDKIYIILDIKEKDIIAHRVVCSPIKINDKKYLQIKETLGKWNLLDLKNLIGEGSLPIENTLKRILPIIHGFNSLIKLLENEKRISIQMDIKENDIIAYQVALAVLTLEGKNIAIVNRVLGKYNLNDYIKPE